jgi:hypothetical protein
MNNEHIRCSTSSAIRKMQIKTTMRHHYTPTSMAIINNTMSINKDVEKLASMLKKIYDPKR